MGRTSHPSRQRGLSLVELETWARCERYLPQAQVCAQLLEQYDLAFAEAARLLHQTGNYLLAHGRYAEAERYLQQALQMCQKILPAEHPYTIIALQSYAYLLRLMGRENEAVALETRFKAK